MCFNDKGNNTHASNDGNRDRPKKKLCGIRSHIYDAYTMYNY